MNFKVSDKVVCVDDRPGLGTIDGVYDFPAGYIKRGVVYVVLGSQVVTFQEGDILQLILVGVPAIHKREGFDVGFAARRFRLLSEVQAENRAQASLRDVMGKYSDAK